jgi:hypothetical protein
MGHQRAKGMLAQQLYGSGAIGAVFLLRPGAPGIAGKKRKSIGPNGQGRLDHSHIALGIGQVASGIQHSQSHPFAIPYHISEEKSNYPFLKAHLML